MNDFDFTWMKFKQPRSLARYIRAAMGKKENLHIDWRGRNWSSDRKRFQRRSWSYASKASNFAREPHCLSICKSDHRHQMPPWRIKEERNHKGFISIENGILFVIKSLQSRMHDLSPISLAFWEYRAICQRRRLCSIGPWNRKVPPRTSGEDLELPRGSKRVRIHNPDCQIGSFWTVMEFLPAFFRIPDQVSLHHYFCVFGSRICPFCMWPFALEIVIVWQRKKRFIESSRA